MNGHSNIYKYLGVKMTDNGAPDKVNEEHNTQGRTIIVFVGYTLDSWLNIVVMCQNNRKQQHLSALVYTTWLFEGYAFRNRTSAVFTMLPKKNNFLAGWYRMGHSNNTKCIYNEIVNV